jgi:hypothetical protein
VTVMPGPRLIAWTATAKATSARKAKITSARNDGVFVWATRGRWLTSSQKGVSAVECGTLPATPASHAERRGRKHDAAVSGADPSIPEWKIDTVAGIDYVR